MEVGSLRVRGRSEGFTLIETLVAMSIAGILMATAVWGMHGYLVSSREQGTAADIRSSLRNASERALSEGKTYCVKFTSTTWSTYQHDCTVAADLVEGPISVDDPSITLSPSFVAPTTPVTNESTACPTTSSCAYFYPRGTALAGTVTVARSGKTYTITVERLTSRVSSS